MKKLTIIGALTAGVAMLGASPAFACSCVPAPSPEAHIDGYDDIFTGQVISGSLSSGAIGGPGGGFGDVVGVVAVNTIYKGDVGDVALIGTALSSATCGVPVTVGATQTFFASENPDGSYGINLCGQLAFDQDPAAFQAALDALPAPTGGIMQLRRPIELNQRFRLVPIPAE